MRSDSAVIRDSVSVTGSASSALPLAAHIRRPTELVGVAAGNHLAVATSGSAERGAHIIDPHTRTSPTALAAVTVIGRDLATTDAYATAAFAMGLGAPAWITAVGGLSGTGRVRRRQRMGIVAGRTMIIAVA
jgi:thiamine biosynthesis lipoprotein